MLLKYWKSTESPAPQGRNKHDDVEGVFSYEEGEDGDALWVESEKSPRTPTTYITPHRN
jgi:hypothetical protein